jgi:pimeloyl-ACP methyl ester carboxylesterase
MTLKSDFTGKLWTGKDVSNTTDVKRKNPDSSIGKEISPIICIHGWLDNACSFDPLLPLIMRPNMTAVAVDLPGHGFSSHVHTSHYDSVMDGFNTINRVIRHFGWKKVTLLGHSLGSVISYIYTGVFPE